MGDAGYNVLVDLNVSGVIEQDEYDVYQNDPYDPYVSALDAGAISNPDFDSGPWSCTGYDGYVYDDIADLSCVRFRWYDAGLGRWMTRDPAGVIDGPNLLQYVRSDPIDFVDSYGRWALRRSHLFAKADAVSDHSDTIADLALKAGLDADWFKHWLVGRLDQYQLTDGSQRSFNDLKPNDTLCPDQGFLVPNTIIAFLWGQDTLVVPGLSRLKDNVIASAVVDRDNHLRQLEFMGFSIRRVSGANRDAFLNSLSWASRNKDLLGLYLDVHHKQRGGEGEWWGTNITTKRPMTWKEMRWQLRYRIGFGYFAACDTTGSDIDRLKSSNPLFWFTWRGEFNPLRGHDPVPDSFQPDISPSEYLDSWGPWKNWNGR
jgi:RHS repeat-associated protein